MNGAQIRHVNGKCLHVAGASHSAGAAIPLYTCNGSNAQRWIVDQTKNEIRNAYSGLCLDVEGVNSADGTSLVMWTCHGQANQKWKASRNAVAPIMPDAGNWVLKFSDEFNASSLNTQLWQTGWWSSGITGPVNNYESACYNSNNIELSDGALWLWLRQQESSCGSNGTVKHPYTGALINTRDSYQFTYGFAEARIYVPGTATGTVNNWPAFWLNNDNWPRYGEIDIFEGLSGEACANFHWDDGGDLYTSGSRPKCTDTNMTGWHTFGAHWQPGRIDYYYDGKLIHTVSGSIVTGQPMYLILNQSTSLYSPYAPVAPDAILVDYVRVWQRQ